MQTPTWMARKFGAGSAVALATKPGAVLRGLWISTKTATAVVAIKDGASTGAAVIVPSTVVAAFGWWEMGGIGMGTGLWFSCLSCTGFIAYQPSSSGV